MKRNVAWVLGILLGLGLLGLSVERATNPRRDALVALQKERIGVDRISCRHYFLSRDFSCAGRLDPQSLAAVEEYRVLDRDDPDDPLHGWHPSNDEKERCRLPRPSVEVYQFTEQMMGRDGYAYLDAGVLVVNGVGRFCFFSGYAYG